MPGKYNAMGHIYGLQTHQGLQDCRACFPALHSGHFKSSAFSLNPDPSLPTAISVDNPLSEFAKINKLES